MLGGAVVLFFAAGALLGAAGDPPAAVVEVIAFGLIIACMCLLGLGLFGLAASMTMRRALRRHAWQSYSCRFRELPTGVTPNGTPVLVLDEKHTVTISSAAWRWRRRRERLREQVLTATPARP